MRGGKRPGAGRPPGAATRKTREVADRAADAGITPIEYMLQVLRDESQAPEVRMDAAKAAAPYIHPRLSAIEASVSHDLASLDEDDLDRRIADAAAEAGVAGLARGEEAP